MTKSQALRKFLEEYGIEGTYEVLEQMDADLISVLSGGVGMYKKGEKWVLPLKVPPKVTVVCPKGYTLVDVAMNVRDLFKDAGLRYSTVGSVNGKVVIEGIEKTPLGV